MDQKDHEDYSRIIIHLMQGILYRDEKTALWDGLLRYEASIRDYLQIIGLDVEIFPADGFAYLKSLETLEGQESLPRLVTRRSLSYPVSLILALLRRKLTEHDAFSSEARLILEVEEVRDMLTAFFPGGSNEVKVQKRLDAHLQRIQELGFIRFLGGKKEKLEVRRILKAFVDAQWLSDFEEKLKEYAAYGVGKVLEGDHGNYETGDEFPRDEIQ